MKDVIVYIGGWRDDRDVLPLSFVTTLRECLSVSLPEAKRMLDDFANDGCIRLEVSSLMVGDLQAAMEGLGAVVRVQDLRDA